MATTVTSTERVIDPRIGGGPRPGNGHRNGNGAKGGADPMRFYADRYRLGMWVALAGIVMLFTALTSAYIVRTASANDWRPIAIPNVLWLSTLVIIVSSVTFEGARRALKSQDDDGYGHWLIATTILGLAFLVSQLWAWRQLVGQGIYLSSNPHSSFFYLLTGAHALHLLGGLLALTFLWVRSRRKITEAALVAKRQAAADAVTIYWHFMDGLWIYLFLLLFLWR